ncbi:hypothetical protein EI77_03499 [Prosthecobacter fusiformis]|uniref:Uncharacterized protein n=1 Tax=Prosthecobacter fusiformis TaxID=48464 RepID=A0A4R7RRC4_9BACT|nr:hypothetical protein [Prosthecobacter fusiformis]TDU67296.1 hypothetical protein EI77_03499 [Prosthecobacter fusiformis]
MKDAHDPDTHIARAALGEIPLEQLRQQDASAAALISKLTQGLDDDAPVTALPAHVLDQLEKTRSQALATRAPQRVSSGMWRNSLLRMAAVLALLLTGIWLLRPPAVPTAQIVLRTPTTETRSVRPTIAWDSADKPGQKYDVWILPAEGDHLTAPVLFVAKDVESPVRFGDLKPGPDVAVEQLEKGKDYRVLVCLASIGRHAGVPVTFHVTPAPAP